ncbi:MAG: molybdenum cofactor guanylyltransferase, partial [Acidimicrobiia bacterium]|nr:molybdenum cofactor guanylyltransferase [Acidimicrobiia bacterium]
MTPRFSGAVLCGGASTRFGTDKAFATVGDRLLIETALAALHEAGAAEVFVVGGDQERIRDLGADFVGDAWPGEGPLGGLITALEHAREPTVAVLACDHPATGAPAVRSIVGAIGRADAAIPVVAGKRQVLHSAWRRTVAGRLTTRFDAGERSIRRVLGELDIVQVLDGDPCWYADI